MVAARVALSAFAASLLAASVLKGLDPFPAMHALCWTGAEPGMRWALVAATVVVEAWLGSMLLVGCRRRWVLWAVVLLASAFLAARIATPNATGTSCGCFGSVVLPNGILVALPAVGLAGSMLLLALAGAPSRLPPPRSWGGCVLTGIAMLPLLTVGRFEAAVEPTETELVTTLGLAGDTEPTLAVIGSWGCPHCVTAWREIQAFVAGDPAWKSVRTCMVVRESDGADPQEASQPTRRIPDRLWWRAIGEAPPAFLTRGAGGAVALARSWTRP